MRDNRIDLLRAFGLAMIILAHVRPPAPIMQLRNFDVPLMVLIAGMSFALSFRQEPYMAYVWKRVKRLVFPVWIFLACYFSAISLFNIPIEQLSTKIVAESFLLMDGIGYVWIIKVFLLVALVSPLIYRFHQHTPDNRRYFGLIALAFGVYEIARLLTMDIFDEGTGKNIAAITHYLIPYSLVFAIGLRLPSMQAREVSWCMNVAFLTFISLATFFFWKTGGFVPTQTHKYPPTIYYFSYAVAISTALWLLSGGICAQLQKLRTANNLMLFMAQNSIWIYLWHIPLIKVIYQPFPIKYLMVFTLACAITYVQVWVVNNLITKIFTTDISQRNIKMILTG